MGEGGGKGDLLYRVETIVDPCFYGFECCKTLCVPMVARRPKLLDDRRGDNVLLGLLESLND